MKLAVSFTNFGPYHLARLRALAGHLKADGGTLVAYETAGTENKYAWRVSRSAEPFEWITLFPGMALEELSPQACRRGVRDALDRDRPDALGIIGYVRPESMAALSWAEREGRPTILMSESQAIDRPRLWWKEAIKRRRVPRFSAALVGGPNHREYLIELGMPKHCVALGYDAVDNTFFADRASAARSSTDARKDLPERPYFLAVSRFAPEKNLPRLVRAFACYRAQTRPETRWDLVLCGGGPTERDVVDSIRTHGCDDVLHRLGFLQADELARWYAHAGAFVLPSLSEPWGLVANEAAACGVPLLVSDRCGCVETLVPEPAGTTGWRFDPTDEYRLAGALRLMADLPAPDRIAMGRRAAKIVAEWGPERFAQGMMDALAMARTRESHRRIKSKLKASQG